ncbi:chemokine XC receptor 1-like [Myxocyprinus asiaticus]|uniref:chemokine XC receptor 1-like n=1 Tax=Myxocyprinus asiaticus TaxID=70543 RepID=UPI0022229410|nr:chemokine XC receptor 1-like [Myxocyprinus asiaticus]
MNNSVVNSNIGEVSKNSSTQSFGLMDSLEICLYSLNFLVGLPTHSYVIWLIVTGTGSGSGIASGFFNLNLSVSEIGNCLNCLFCVLDYFTPFTSLKAFLFGLGITGRPLFQCLICIERYLAVVHPVTFLKIKPLRYKVICSTAAWIITFGSCLCCMLILVLFDSYIYVWFFLLHFIFFLSIQLFCLLAVLRALKQSGPGERGRERGEENSMKRRAFYLILITTVNMGIVYVPLTISGFFIIMTQQNIDESYFIGFFFFVLNGFVQPVLYLHCTGKLSFLCRSKMCNCEIIQS